MTIKEIASIAEVSISTVSKIINNKDSNISAETRNRVLKVVKEYNYFTASSDHVFRNKSFVWGAVLSSTSDSAGILAGLLESAQKQGYSLLLRESYEDACQEQKNLASVSRSNIDGLVWQPVDSSNVSQLRALEPRQIPTLYVGQCEEHAASDVDFVGMSYLAVQELLSRGHTRIACLLTQPNYPHCRAALSGFRRALFNHQMTFSLSMVFRSGSSLLARIHEDGITGVFCPDSLQLYNLYEQLGMLHFHVPKDISLIGLCSDCYTGPIPFSAYTIPYKQLGLKLGNRLAALCEKTEFNEGECALTYQMNGAHSLDLPRSSGRAHIVVVGSVNIDITLNVDELPQPGKTVSTSKCFLSPGGKGVNQAVGIARLGHRSSLIAKVGNDTDATIVYSSLSSNDVDATGVQKDQLSNTGKAYIHLQNDGESSISILTGANEHLSAEDVAQYSYLFHDASFCLLQTEVPLAAVKEAIAQAKQHNVRTILKPAALSAIDSEFMSGIDYFVPNRKEAELLCPNKPLIEDKAAYFLEMGAANVIITLGHQGCYLRNAHSSFYFDAKPAVTVDTTGAADAFVAALAVYLSYGFPLENAIPIANYAAGFCISRQGVVPALVDRSTLELHICKYEPRLLAKPRSLG